MYIDNICVSYALAENNINQSPYQPVVSTQEENNSFNEILTDTINETIPSYQVNPEPPAEKANETAAATGTNETTAVENVNNVIPMDSVPPVIKPQETAASSYVSQYYPIKEEEVIQNLSNVRHVINNTNMSGKTDSEKYDLIEKKFKETFGDDFMIARNLSLPSTMFYLIGIEFSDTLGRHIENPEQINRERLYGDKSTSAVQDAIRNKYPEEMTNRDMFLMVNEMRNSGVLDNSSIRTIGNDGAKRLVDTLSLMQNYARFLTRDSNNHIKPLSMEERDKKLLSLFNKKLDTGELFILHNEWKGSGRIATGNDTAPLFVKYLDAVLDENGFFVLGKDVGIGYDMTQIFELLMNEMNEYDDFIKDRMKLIDGVVPTVVIEVPGQGDEQNIEEVPGAEDGIITDDASGIEDGDSTGAEDYSGAGAEENIDSDSEAA